MKLVQFILHNGKARLGILEGDKIIDINSGANWIPNNLVEFLAEHSHNAFDLLEKLRLHAVDSYELSKVHLLAPITKPDKILGVGLNYKDYCDENNISYPAEPIVFSKFGSTIVGPYDAIKKPDASNAVDWEVELVAVIGKISRNVKSDDALDHIFGYTATQDLTAKDWMTKNGGQFLLCKNMDHFCPLGPCVVTRDEIKDPHDVNVKTWVNGILKQNGNTKNIIHRIDKLVEHLSSVMTLLPGDIICTGTPSGVGSTRNPPEFLKRGDLLESEVEFVGKLANNVI